MNQRTEPDQSSPTLFGQRLACLLASGLLATLPLAATEDDPTPLAGSEAEIVVDGAPSFRDVLDLESVSSPEISPDGSQVAFVRSTVDWEENRWDREIWLSRDGEEPFQLTRTAGGNSSSPQWSPDGGTLTFVARRGDGTEVQVFAIDPRGGEARALTRAEHGVGAYAWSPTGDAIFYSEAEPADLDAREEEYGRFQVEDRVFSYSHLWRQALESGKPNGEPEQLTSGSDFTVTDLAPSPDGSSVAIRHQPTPRIDDFPNAALSVVEIESGDLRTLVEGQGGASLGHWSPDGSWLSISSALGNNAWYGNSPTARVEVATGKIENLTADFDEDTSPIAWTDEGIWFSASQRTERGVFLIGGDGSIERADLGLPMHRGASINARGDIAFIGEDGENLPELYLRRKGASARKLTDLNAQVADWPGVAHELVRWKSRDGLEIEGVLSMPAGHDASKPGPLLVVIHGGPTGTSRPARAPSYVYPITQWLARGALVLQPNYRGSAGYGAEFRAANVRNLGVGDQWDVESGVDFLIERGLVDADKVGAMGWSQGGYISAMLSANSKMFQAISNGAGISDWMTYYVNTDIHGFTRQYLEGTPWDDPEVYAKTSPMTYIRNAQTPTLIQHGDGDARVPLPNAYELYQGLQDVGVETELIVYTDFGHGITRPKERLAAIWHNWRWFEKHLFGNEVDLPMPEEEAEE